MLIAGVFHRAPAQLGRPSYCALAPGLLHTVRVGEATLCNEG